VVEHRAPEVALAGLGDAPRLVLAVVAAALNGPHRVHEVSVVGALDGHLVVGDRDEDGGLDALLDALHKLRVAHDLEDTKGGHRDRILLVNRHELDEVVGGGAGVIVDETAPDVPPNLGGKLLLDDGSGLVENLLGDGEGVLVEVLTPADGANPEVHGGGVLELTTAASAVGGDEGDVSDFGVRGRVRQGRAPVRGLS